MGERVSHRDKQIYLHGLAGSVESSAPNRGTSVLPTFPSDLDLPGGLDEVPVRVHTKQNHQVSSTVWLAATFRDGPVSMFYWVK